MSDADPAPTRSPSTSLDSARAALAAVCAFAEREGLSLATVVVDSGGHVVAGERMDGAPFPAYALAAEKAWTASAFGVATAVWQEQSQPGTDYWGLTSAGQGRFSVLPGGLPILIEDRLAGGIGVSGGSGDQDVAAARAGVAAFERIDD